jgi:hypothetical protein
MVLQDNARIRVSDRNNSHDDFMAAIKSPATKKAYDISLRRYLNYTNKKETDELLLQKENPRYIEYQLIDYIKSLRNSGVSYSTIKFLIAPIITFYQLNDVVINRKKVSRYMGEYKRVVKDQAYSTESIETALRTADARMRMCILILSSCGCRIGSLPNLTLGSLTKLPDYGLYKIVFYEGTNNEYYSFLTKEASDTGVDNFLSYRIRCGEKISFNTTTQKWEPSNVPLIRQQFDVTDLLQVRNPKPMTIYALRGALTLHLIRSGIRIMEHPTAPDSLKRIRKSIALANGFRKRAISIFIEANLNHEIRELIVDHATMLDQNYFRPSQESVLREFLKAEPLLCIDPSVRLQKENEQLKIEKSSLDALAAEVEKLKAAIATNRD